MSNTLYRCQTQTPNGPLMVGAAQVEITPDLPVRRGGGGVGGLAASYTSEVHCPLTAQSVAWGDDQQCIIWTSCDLGSVEDEFVAVFRQIVSAETGLPYQRINLSATHSHGGPSGPKFSIYHTESSMSETRSTYLKMMEKAAKSAVEAYRNRQPVRLGYGSGRAERACFNRRFIMSNGTVRMHGKESEGVKRLQAEGPVDDELQIVWFEGNDSRLPKAMLVNLASHPNQMYGKNALGSEYPGVMREVIWRALGQRFPIVFLQGACGNVQPVDIEEGAGWGEGMEGIHTIGHLLAGEVLKLIHSSKAQETTGILLAQANAPVELSLRVFPQEEAECTLRIVREAKQAGDLKARLDHHFKTVEEKARAKQIVLLETLREKGDTELIELGAMRLGDIVFITTPAHQFVEFQIALKKAFPGKKIILADLTNGSANYIPTPLAIALGGYETEHRRYEPAAGEKIMTAGAALARELFHLT